MIIISIKVQDPRPVTRPPWPPKLAPSAPPCCGSWPLAGVWRATRMEVGDELSPKWVWVNTYRYHYYSGMNIHKSQLFLGVY